MRVPRYHRKIALLSMRIKALSAKYREDPDCSTVSGTKIRVTFQTVEGPVSYAFNAGYAKLGYRDVTNNITGARRASRRNQRFKNLDTFLKTPNQLVRNLWKAELEQHIEVLKSQSRTMPQATFDRILQYPVSTDALGVFSFGKIIGINPVQTRHIVDYKVQRSFPSFSSIVVPEQKANEFIEAYGGLYYLYRWEDNALARDVLAANKIMSRTVVSIRYPIPHWRSQKDTYNVRSDCERLRVKWMMPLYPGSHRNNENRVFDKKLTYAKYDGYVAPPKHTSGTNTEIVLRRSWQWLLELRPSNLPEEEQDLILMYSDKPEISSDGQELLYATGDMFTQDQQLPPKPTHSKTLLVKLPGYSIRPFGPHDTSNFMEGNYMGLWSHDQEAPVNERDILRNQYGFVCDDQFFFDCSHYGSSFNESAQYRHGDHRVPLDPIDKFAWRMLKSIENL